jgi:nicotinate phosphoribosyltransferase
VGTALVTGSGAPTAALVYKLVARAEDIAGELRPVAKRSVGKPSRGGRKWAVRRFDQAGVAEAEVVSTVQPTPSRSDRALLVPLVRDGKAVGAEPLAEARERHQRVLAELPLYALQLSRGYPAIPTLFEPDAR